MKKIFIIMGIIILFILIGSLININKKMDKEQVLNLLNKVDAYKNLKITTIIEDESDYNTNTEFLKKDNIEIYKVQTKDFEQIIWKDMDKDEEITIDVISKTYQFGSDNKKINYDDEKCKFRFIGYEDYNNARCVVVEFTYDNIMKDMIWIDLKTGVILKKIGVVNSYKYTQHSEVVFDSVNDQDIIKPNISEYTLIEKSDSAIIDNIPVSSEKFNNINENKVFE